MKQLTAMVFGYSFRPVYENGEAGGEGGTTTTTTGAGGGGATTTTNTGTATTDANGQPLSGDPNDPLVKMKFTKEQQEFMNKKIQEEKKAAQEHSRQTINELKKIQQAASTSEQQKKELQDRINQLQQQFLSKEELAKQEQEKQQREFQEQLRSAKNDAERWQKMYHDSTVARALQDGAIKFEAYNPGQIQDLLFHKTKLIEEMDEDNKPTGRFIPRVQIEEQEGDRITRLDLSVEDTLQKMKNTPDRYGNLFKSTLAGGLGQNGSSNGTGGGRGRGKSPKDMTAAEWAEARKKDPTLSFADQGAKR